MKTLETLMEEIKGSEEMQKEFWTLNSKETMDAFFKKHDCEAVTEDFAAFMQAGFEKFQAEQAEGEISDDAAEAVAGGGLEEFIASLLPFCYSPQPLYDADAAVTTFFTQTLPDAFSSGGSSAPTSKRDRQIGRPLDITASCIEMDSYTMNPRLGRMSKIR